MNKLTYPRIGETVLTTTLSNGLRICVVPKPGYQKKYAFFTTRYGGMDMKFNWGGTWYDTPAGIAHYLEHKMFDTEDGNALVELSQNGAEPNAFTSNAITAYYFDCTEHFEENLRILLSFVTVPYFTDESVEKERGIIGQEIRMVEDTPDWQVYEKLLECLYRSSPARIPIAGTVESIAEITAETLYACHKAFYDPKNMMLCIIGVHVADNAEHHVFGVVKRLVAGVERFSADLRDAFHRAGNGNAGGGGAVETFEQLFVDLPVGRVLDHADFLTDDAALFFYAFVRKIGDGDEGEEDAEVFFKMLRAVKVVRGDGVARKSVGFRAVLRQLDEGVAVLCVEHLVF